jgi:hypothetical protein
MPNLDSHFDESPIQVGARLPEAVFDANGAILFAKGQIVTPEIFSVLRRSDASDTVTDLAERNVEGAGAIAERLSFVFRRVHDNPAALELLRQVLAYRAKTLP